MPVSDAASPYTFPWRLQLAFSLTRHAFFMDILGSFRKGTTFVVLLLLFNVSLAIVNTDLVLSVQTTVPGALVHVPFGRSGATGPTLNLAIDWGDATTEIYTNAFNNDTLLAYTISHVYAQAGDYTIVLSRNGAGPVWLSRFGWGADSVGWSSISDVNFLGVSSFGDLGITSLELCFLRAGSTNNFAVPPNIPSTVTNLNSAFAFCSAFNQALDSWDVSGVTSMAFTFQAASAFNQPLASWNVAKVTTMQNMFDNAQAFNQPIGSWNVGAVTNMNAMLYNAIAFNQPIDSWNTASVTDMSSMFQGATAFNQPINSWNTASVTAMSSMFLGATAFNQPIGSWNVGKVTSMLAMFSDAKSFNQPIGSWNVASVTRMTAMFSQASAFNQPIGSWNVGSVFDMDRMFQSAVAFNQPIGDWDVSSVRYMGGMFDTATVFDQSLRFWCVSKIPTQPNFFAEASKLFIFNYPVWGTCPVRPPSAVPVSLSAPISVAPKSASDIVTGSASGLTTAGTATALLALLLAVANLL